MDRRFIPVNIPDVRSEDKENVAKSLEDGWISGEGPFVAEFETKFAELCDRKHGISVTNGTAALELAIQSLNLLPGDEVILPAFTIISCLNEILRVRAKPVFIDADSKTWNMNPELVREAITSRTKAILVVHIYGLPVDMNPIVSLSAEFGIPIVEDAAEAHGQAYFGKPCGSFGMASTFSFYANKNITTGEGGMVLTDDDSLAARYRYLKNLGFRPEERFVNYDLAWNLRLSSLQCALGTPQISRIREIVSKRMALGQAYHQAFSNFRGIKSPLLKMPYADNHFWVYGMVLSDDSDLDSTHIRSALEARGVGTRPFFYPLNRQPLLREIQPEAEAQMPEAEKLYKKGFYIPNGLGMSEVQAEQVVEIVSEVLESNDLR